LPQAQTEPLRNPLQDWRRRDQFQKGESMALTNTLVGRNLGMLLLGLWLILTGLLPLLNVRVSSTVTTGLAVLGIVAGILILLRR